jgi:uncharacterized protein (TIGR02145 family)
MSENSGDNVSTGSANIIKSLYDDMVDGRIDDYDIITAINNFKNSSGDFNATNGTGASNTGSAESANGEDTIMGSLSIDRIDNYSGDNITPTLEDYINAGVTGVTADNLASTNSIMIGFNVSTTALIQARVEVATEVIETSIAIISNYESYSNLEDTPTVLDYGNAGVTGVTEENLGYMNDKIASTSANERDTTAKIQRIIDDVAVVNFSIDPISVISIPENAMFTGPTPNLTGETIGVVIYTISGADENAFTITSTNGVVSMAPRNFESPDDVNADNVYEIIIIATDEDGNNDNESMVVTVTNVSESAKFTIDAIKDVSINEHEAFTGVVPRLSGEVPYGDVTYTLEGVDGSNFTIDSATGVVSTTGLDFDYPLDANKDSIYEIVITATDLDGNTDGEDQLIKIIDFDEDYIAILPIDDVVIYEHTDFVGVTPVLVAGYTPAETVTYTLGGADASDFTIDSVTGVVSMPGVNFEDPKDDNKDNDYEIVIIVTDSNNETYSEQQTITIVDIDESLELTIDNITDVAVISGVAFTGATPSIGGGTPYGTPTFSLKGIDAASFTIDSLTGVVSMVARDMDTPEDNNKDNIYKITIVVVDLENNTATKDQAITVTFAGTVVGTQIWTATNVNFTPSIHNTIGIDYWQGADGGTVDDGYYYTWNAAMEVCPSGWSLPSDNDWKILEGFLGMSAADQDAVSWRSTDVGTQLKENGASGLDIKLTGLFTTERLFKSRDEIAYLWTSTEGGSGSSDAYRRNVTYSERRVYRDTIDKSYAFGVRCIR